MAQAAEPWRPLTIRLTRRSRTLAADSWLEAPLGEELEACEIEILDGAAVKRTLVGTTTSVTYTGADQIADCGAPLGPGDSLAIRLFQLSTLVVRQTQFGAGSMVWREPTTP